MWEPQHETLAGWDWMAPNLYELPGESMESWAAALLERIPDEIAAVGASMGGYLALELARQAPERIRGLLLAGARAGADSPERRAAREETIRVLREDGLAAWSAGVPWGVSPRYGADDFARATRALRDRRDAAGVVASFAGPLLVVAGEEDELLSGEEARAVASSAPDGSVEVISGAGHIVSRDRPERFNELLRGFLERCA
jgi:pimeloyl-ACP methyl ester carboxylesterase